MKVVKVLHKQIVDLEADVERVSGLQRSLLVILPQISKILSSNGAIAVDADAVKLADKASLMLSYTRVQSCRRVRAHDALGSGVSCASADVVLLATAHRCHVLQHRQCAQSAHGGRRDGILGVRGLGAHHARWQGQPPTPEP